MWRRCLTSFNCHVLAQRIRSNRHQINPFISYVYRILLLVRYLIFIFTFTFVLMLILKFIYSLVVVRLEIGLFLFWALLASICPSKLIDLIKGHWSHAKNVYATSCDVLLTIPEVILREHVSLSGSEQKRGLAIRVWGIKSTDRWLWVVQSIFARFTHSCRVCWQYDFAVWSRIMRFFPFWWTCTLLLTNISHFEIFGVLWLFTLTGSLSDKDGVLDLIILFNCMGFITFS